MTREELGKHIKPLKWIYYGKGSFRTADVTGRWHFIKMKDDGTWVNRTDGLCYPNLEKAKQSVEEYHLRNLVEFFDLEED